MQVPADIARGGRPAPTAAVRRLIHALLARCSLDYCRSAPAVVRFRRRRDTSLHAVLLLHARVPVIVERTLFCVHFLQS